MQIKGRILSVDYGLKRIGLALSDPTQTLATPLPAIKGHNNFEKDCQALYEIAKEKEVCLVLIGFPQHLDGKASDLSTLSSKLASQLQERYSLKVELYDERLTSSLAEKLLKDKGLNRKKRSQAIDSMAASLFLQDFLDQV